MRFEFYSFALEGDETGMLPIDVPASAGTSTLDAAHAAAASLTIVNR